MEFWDAFIQRTGALETALQRGDAHALKVLVDELASCLCAVDHRLGVTVYGPDPFRLLIRCLPGAEAAMHSVLATHRAPPHWRIGGGLPVDDELRAVHVTDDRGDTLTLHYSDLGVRVLPPRDGSITIVFSLDGDVEMEGPRAHLYQAAADCLVETLLGVYPQELAYAVLLPAARTGPLPPVTTLRQQWAKAVGNEHDD